jgi:GNAT superfamily N-acetyltransferase
MSTPTPDIVAVTLDDGRRVTIRPIRRDDVARNAAFLDELSPPSKHFLFLGGIAKLSDAELERLCDPDHAHDMAFVAVARDLNAAGGERQVGVCRYAGTDTEAGAEISVAVADDWQHRGLGKLLLHRLIEHVESWRSPVVLMDTAANEPMRRLARDVGFREQRDPTTSGRSSARCTAITVVHPPIAGLAPGDRQFERSPSTPSRSSRHANWRSRPLALG